MFMSCARVTKLPPSSRQSLSRSGMLAKRRRLRMIAGAMTKRTEQLEGVIEGAMKAGELRVDAAQNIKQSLSGEASDFYRRVINELASAGAWPELNDRFYKTLAFGTGGLRGRTIGKIITAAERGRPTALGRPEFA